MRTKLFLCLGFWVLIAAGCTDESSRWPHQATTDIGSIKSESGQPAPVAAEVINSPVTLQQCIEIALKNNPQVVGGSWDVLAVLAVNSIRA